MLKQKIGDMAFQISFIYGLFAIRRHKGSFMKRTRKLDLDAVAEEFFLFCSRPRIRSNMTRDSRNTRNGASCVRVSTTDLAVTVVT